MAWTSPRTWVAGEVVTAALLNTHLRDNLLELNGTASAWTAWTPTLTNFTATVNEARYKQVGKTVHFEFYMTLTAAPTGALTVSLPVTARTSPIGGGAGLPACQDTSVGLIYTGEAVMASTTTLTFHGPNTGQWNATVPVAWATGDILRCHGFYEAA